jgi:hypothetical protein
MFVWMGELFSLISYSILVIGEKNSSIQRIIFMQWTTAVFRISQNNSFIISKEKI